MQNYRFLGQKDTNKVAKAAKPKKIIPSAFSKYNSAVQQINLNKGPSGSTSIKSKRQTPSLESPTGQAPDDDMNFNDFDEKEMNTDFEEGNQVNAFNEAINVKRTSKVISNFQGGSFLKNSTINSKKKLQIQSNMSKVQMRPNRFSNGQIVTKSIKQPQTQKNSQVRKVQLVSTSPKDDQTHKSNGAKYQMIQNLPPSVVLKKSKKLATPAASAWVSPTSSLSKGFKLGSADSFKDNKPSAKNLMAKPIVPPHLKQQSSKYPISANVSPKDSFNLLKNKNKSFLAAKKPQQFSNYQQSQLSKKSTKVISKFQAKPLVINLQEDDVDLRSQGIPSSSSNSKYQSFKQFQNPKSGQQTHTNTMKNSLNGSQLDTPNQSSMLGLRYRPSEQPVFNLSHMVSKKTQKAPATQASHISSLISKQQSLLIQAHDKGSFRQDREVPFSSPSVRIPNEYGGLESNLKDQQMLNDPDDDDDGDLVIDTERNHDVGGPRAQMKSHTININLRATPSKVSSLSRKGSINDLPQMSITNLNQMRSKQTKQFPDQSSSFNKGSFYSGSLGTGMKLGGTQVSQLEYIRHNGINSNPREDAGSESRAINVNTQSIQSKMTIIRKPIQSKTAQVSAYASKNNSNNSSQVRIPSGAPSKGGPSSNSILANSNRLRSGLSSVTSSNNPSLNLQNLGHQQIKDNNVTLKAKVRDAVAKQGNKFEPHQSKQNVKNYSLIVNSVKSSQKKLSESPKNQESFISSSRANIGVMTSGSNNSALHRPQQVQYDQPTLRSQVKEQFIQERQQLIKMPENRMQRQTSSSQQLEIQIEEEEKSTFVFEDNVNQQSRMYADDPRIQANRVPKSSQDQPNQLIVPKKKHTQPSQGSAQKKGQKRINNLSNSGENQVPTVAQSNGIIFYPEQHHSSNNSPVNDGQIGENQNQNNNYPQRNQLRNPQVSFCQTIDEQNHETTEAQIDNNQQSKDNLDEFSQIPTVFNINNDLQNQINQKQYKISFNNYQQKMQAPQISNRNEYYSPRQSTQNLNKNSNLEQIYSKRPLPGGPQGGGVGAPRGSEASPKSPFERLKKQTSQDDLSENSQQVQLKEYYKDIQKLKRLIRLYFQEYHTIKQSTFEFYRIGRVLGRGAFGKVNLACHKVCEHLVAIKSIERKVLRNEKQQKKRVMQEMTILKQSGHDNVVRLYDTFETPLHMCFVMELCQGGDLLTYVRKRRKLKEDNAKFLFKQLVMGLNYIHNKKFVVHRDIKLDNILLDQSGRIKICDFGVSKQVASEAERMHDQCGTPAYIAPEIIKGRGYRGFKTDMWSAGICLFVMLVGTVPFRASTMDQLHELIQNGKYDLSGENLSHQAKDLLSKLIEVEPRKRLDAAKTLQHPWLQSTQDKKQPIDVNRSDLADIIFTEKEKQTIKKDYISRLEKIKQKRFQKDTKPKKLVMPRKSTLNQSSRQTDGDFIFTEHNLDTKEDERIDKKPGTQQSIKSFFKSKPQGPENSFAKLEGFNVRPKPLNPKNEDEQSNAHDLNIKTNNQRNVSEQSIIYAPFNTSQSGFDEDHPELFQWPKEVLEKLQPKKSKILKFSKKCRDLNREYESNNNADLDNGVYNAFVNEQEAEAEKLKQVQHQEQMKLQGDQPLDLGESLLPQNIAYKMQQIGQNQDGQEGNGEELEDLNDATNLSSDDEHALASIKEFENKVKIKDDTELTEAQELSIHESMQKIHEYNHNDNEDFNSDDCINIKGPTRSSEVGDTNIDLMIVKYTADLFLEHDTRKSDAPVIKEFKMSPPRNIAKFDSFNSKVKVNNLFDVKSPKKQKNPTVLERQEYQVQGGSDNAAFLSEMKIQLQTSLRKQEINYLTAAYYLTRKHEFN